MLRFLFTLAILGLSAFHWRSASGQIAASQTRLAVWLTNHAPGAYDTEADVAVFAAGGLVYSLIVGELTRVLLRDRGLGPNLSRAISFFGGFGGSGRVCAGDRRSRDNAGDCDDWLSARPSGLRARQGGDRDQGRGVGDRRRRQADKSAAGRCGRERAALSRDPPATYFFTNAHLLSAIGVSSSDAGMLRTTLK